MKKLLMALTLTMALATGAQSAFADCGCPVQKSDCGCKPKCERQYGNPCQNKCGCDTKDRNDSRCGKKGCGPTCEECAESARRCYSNCRDQKREELYCRLNLNDCQRERAMEIENRYDSDLDCISDKIKNDHKCLCKTLNAACLDKSEVRNQERVLKDDFKDLKSKLKCMDKEFKSILEGCQKSEYRKAKREMKYRVKHSRKYCCKPCCNK